jgi:hypothetical protein
MTWETRDAFNISSFVIESRGIILDSEHPAIRYRRGRPKIITKGAFFR